MTAGDLVQVTWQVTWQDAMGYTNADIEETGTVKCVTVGWLRRRDDSTESLTIQTSMYPDTTGDFVVIPGAWVTGLEILRPDALKDVMAGLGA